ncbi:hypothetical protein L484_024430 [Morus notabilis]|uniref:Protein POLAR LOCALIZATION DURING ASYMMETRIC DIVISION AND REDISTRIBUTION n=1 Tax=Morus notabilis TaxID=981085 RepID=W9RXA7_9ROSA|nr:uncharacterized protein LOC21407169 [Morus notabilis]EXC16256.1 hypothetical protein L484_024430 [Morus notabilis]
MWQALVAAAVAGTTGIVAKHFLKPASDHAHRPYNGDDLGDQPINREDESRFLSASALGSELDLPRASVPEEEDEIFRFSSTGSRVGRRNLSKNKGALRKGVRGERSAGSKQRSGERRVGVCLKRRKTSKIGAGKRESCSSNDTSLFGWGLGVGIMYMVSTGKAEFCKLNAAMNETAKVVDELKAELHKRKSSQNLQVSGCASEAMLTRHTTSYKDDHPDHKTGPNDIKSFSSPSMNDVECASSVLTEEPAPGMQEMDQLEAELEFELQQLPWCTLDASSNQEGSKALIETEFSAQAFPEQDRQDSDIHQLGGNGILPAELDQKLCHLLIERQENQIEELESELHLAQHTLNEKEALGRAMKVLVFDRTMEVHF